MVWGLCSLPVVWPEAKTPGLGKSGSVSHWPPKSNSLGFLSPSARSPGWKTVVGPRTFYFLILSKPYGGLVLNSPFAASHWSHSLSGFSQDTNQILPRGLEFLLPLKFPFFLLTCIFFNSGFNSQTPFPSFKITINRSTFQFAMGNTKIFRFQEIELSNNAVHHVISHGMSQVGEAVPINKKTAHVYCETQTIEVSRTAGQICKKCATDTTLTECRGWRMTWREMLGPLVSRSLVPAIFQRTRML